MKIPGIMIALLCSAGSAFAGDLESAQNFGYDSTKGPATVIALVLATIGAGIWWLWKNRKRTKLPVAISAIAVATMLSLHADEMTVSGYGYNSGMWSRFGSWFSSFWTSQFSWGNMTQSFGGFTPVPSVPPKGIPGGRPPSQQN